MAIPSWVISIIAQFSYVGIFLVSILSTSSIFIPAPLYAIVFFSSTLGLNPLVASISAGLGSAIGELTGYLIGLGGSEIAKEKKKSRWVKPFYKYFKKYGFATIVVTAFLPFPFDVVGILSGWSKYDVKKFLIATAIGKIGRCLLLAYSGSFATSYVMSYLGW